MTRTVLVVDDEPKLRRLLRDYLERDGFTVLEADSGQRALQPARAGQLAGHLRRPVALQELAPAAACAALGKPPRDTCRRRPSPPGTSST